MNVKKGVVAGFLAGIAMVIADMVVWGTTQGYLMPLYQASAAVWKPMEPLSVWLAQMWAMTIADGILFGIVYSVLYNGIPGRTSIKDSTTALYSGLWEQSRVWQSRTL
ncbi:MAG: hypothetical protein Q8O41_01675 [Candidatus Methanoperedens sp.]|nr:hypothetical protein [Candidatus Methanoperedens sp.]